MIVAKKSLRSNLKAKNNICAVVFRLQFNCYTLDEKDLRLGQLNWVICHDLFYPGFVAEILFKTMQDTTEIFSLLLDSVISPCMNLTSPAPDRMVRRLPL